MKVDVQILNNENIDWDKPQVVVSNLGERVLLATNVKAIDEDCFCGISVSNGEYSNSWVKKSFEPEKPNPCYPIELKITIEDEKELCNLLHRSSLDSNKVNENTTVKLKQKSNDSDLPLYHILKELTKKYDIS